MIPRVMTFLKAAELLPETPFDIYGKGESLDELKEYVEKRNIRNVSIDTQTRWTSGLKERLCGSKIIVSPSEWPTPLEYSTLEAMSLGKPVIASRIGGNITVVSDGTTGVLFEPGNAEDLSKKIRELFADDEACRAIGGPDSGEF